MLALLFIGVAQAQLVIWLAPLRLLAVLCCPRSMSCLPMLANAHVLSLAASYMCMYDLARVVSLQARARSGWAAAMRSCASRCTGGAWRPSTTSSPSSRAGPSGACAARTRQTAHRMHGTSPSALLTLVHYAHRPLRERMKTATPEELAKTELAAPLTFMVQVGRVGRARLSSISGSGSGSRQGCQWSSGHGIMTAIWRRD